MPAVEPSRYYSPRTSIRQVPALLRALVRDGLLPRGTVNLDLGGGRYDMATKFLAAHGVVSSVYDPGNRTPAHNRAVLAAMQDGNAHTVTIANVLNVIPSADVRGEVLAIARNCARRGGSVFVSTWDGDASARASVTAKGWHANQPIDWYLPEVRAVFPSARVVGQRIEARND